MRYNINENVRLQLTEAGRKVYAASVKDLPADLQKYHIDKVDKDGFVTMQLWDAIETFGGKGNVSLGSQCMPFATEIDLSPVYERTYAVAIRYPGSKKYFLWDSPDGQGTRLFYSKTAAEEAMRPLAAEFPNASWKVVEFA